MQLELRDGAPKTSIKLRYDSIKGNLVHVENDPYFLQYADKIQMINSGYQVGMIIQEFRKLEALDPSRHPQFPDDIVIWFCGKGEKPEGIWGRVESFDGKYVTARLLDEPWGDYGYHQGELIPIDHVETNHEQLAVAVLR